MKPFKEFINLEENSSTEVVIRTEIAGIEQKSGSPATEAAFKRLKGKCVCVTDKSVVLEFPTPSAAREFEALCRKEKVSLE